MYLSSLKKKKKKIINDIFNSTEMFTRGYKFINDDVACMRVGVLGTNYNYIKFKSNHTGGTYLVFVYVKDDREISLQSYKNLLTLS